MLEWNLYFRGLAVIGAIALVGWAIGSARRNVTIVDCLWGVFFLAATLVYANAQWTPRATMIAAMVAAACLDVRRSAGLIPPLRAIPRL